LQPDPGREPLLVRLFRALVLAAAAAAVAHDLALPAGVIGTAVAAAAGALAGERLRRSGLRTAVVVIGAAASPFVAFWLGEVVVSSAWIARWLGAAGTLAVADVLRWGGSAFCLVAASRMLAARLRAVLVVEAAAIALAAAAVVAPHREGFINRPLAIADRAWVRGLDPALCFLAVGAVAALALLVALIRRDRARRALLDLAIVALLAGAFAGAVRVLQPPGPKTSGEMGLTGDPAKQERQQGPDQGKPQPGRPGDRPPGSGMGTGGAEAHAQGGKGSGDPSKAPPPPAEFRDDYSDDGRDTPVAVVTLHEDYSSPLGAYYFRQTAFSQWNGTRLVGATRDDVDGDLPQQFPVVRQQAALPKEWLGPRKAVETTVALTVDHIRPFGLESVAALAPAPNPDPMRFRRVFRVTSQVLATGYEHLLGKTGTGVLGDHYAVGSDDPRYAQLADQIVQRLPVRWRKDPVAQAVAIKDWLEKNGTYSRKSKHAGAGDPTASFLFGTEDRLVGYCVHNAHAMALLLRARGVPSRVAAGYAVAETHRGNGSTILLRGGDAHSWAEVFVPGAGWVVADVSPEKTREEPQQPPDPELQRMMGELARAHTGAPDEPPDQPTDWPSLGAIARVIGIVIAALLALLYAAKAWRRLAPLVAPRRALPRVAYRAALDSLADVGLLRTPGESRERFARRAVGAAPAFLALTDAHLRHAFGPAPRPPNDRALARLALSLAGPLRRSHGTLRLLVGMLNPVSFLRVR
jgi:transglutaminase-like putative cysteine protease